MNRNNIKGVCLILDKELLRVTASQAMAEAIDAGIRFFQYRSKRETRRDTYDTCRRLSDLAVSSGSLFIVNDHADIARAVGADGVHLGQDDLPIQDARKVLGSEKLIGISTHSKGQAVAAASAGANYIGFGPIFETTTKDAGTVQGIQGIAPIKQTVSIPVIAIGGINSRNVRDVIQAGADGVAVISCILCAPDLKQAAAEMNRLARDTGSYQGGI